MNVWYEEITAACSWITEYTEKSTRATVIAECLFWCEERGHKFIQVDFEYEVFYYEEN